MAGTAPSLILILAGVGFIGFGAAYALRPARMAALTDLTLTSPTARADFVATYGGFQIGFGLFLLACAREVAWQVPGLWAVVAALGGFASCRALAILLHRGRVRGSVWFGLGLELFGVALGLWGLTTVHALDGPGGRRDGSHRIHGDMHAVVHAAGQLRPDCR